MNTKQSGVSATSNRAYWAQVVVLGLVVGLGLQFAQAWTAPTGIAPAGTIKAPITTSDSAQRKDGSLNIGIDLSVDRHAVVGGNLSIERNLVLGSDNLASCYLKTNAQGRVGCDNTGLGTKPNISVSGNFTCNYGNTGSPAISKDCAMKKPDNSNYNVCFLTESNRNDGNKATGYGQCNVWSDRGVWKIRNAALDVGWNECSARCLDW